jgi:hypothetical protein
VLALTRLATQLGLMRGTIDRMPSAIHLTRASGPTDAARPILAALAASNFVDAGAWNIAEMPKIERTKSGSARRRAASARPV